MPVLWKCVSVSLTPRTVWSSYPSLATLSGALPSVSWPPQHKLYPLVFGSCSLRAELASQRNHLPEGQPYLEGLEDSQKGLSSMKWEFMTLKFEGCVFWESGFLLRGSVTLSRKCWEQKAKSFASPGLSFPVCGMSCSMSDPWGLLWCILPSPGFHPREAQREAQVPGS